MIKQFVGYWGYGNQQELEGVLTQILNAAPVNGCTAKRFSQHSNCIWGISYICKEALSIEGTYAVSTATGEEAFLSAAGLADVPDAWVKLEQNSLTLGREPFGRVPLYWTKRDRIIWFASKLQLLLPILNTPDVSIAALYGYSCFSYVPTPLTPVAGIFVVAAGVEQIWQGTPDVSTSRRLHEWREAPVLMRDEGEAIAQLQVLLKDAIHRQINNLPSEPVGVFLSGGLDSSVVAALLVQAGVKVRGYTLDFGKYAFAEVPYAEKVAEFLNIPLVKVDATPRKIKGAIAATAQALDLPFGDGVTVPLYLLCQAASQETAVIFNGEGGDQLFAGWTNKPLIAASVYNTEHPAGAEDFTQQYLRTFHRLYGYEMQAFQPDMYAQIQNLSPQEWLKEALDPAFCSGLLHRLRRASLMLKGAQNIHPRATNLAFAHGLVVRSPFCDLPLAEWTFQLPGEFFLQGACEKYLLKRAVESWLPPEIVWREKRGMGVPLTSWYFSELWSEVRNWLNPGILQAEGRWQSQLTLQIITGKLGGQIRGRRIGEILWLLMMWQVWRTTVLGEAKAGNALFNSFWLPPWWWRKLLFSHPNNMY
jgi:asparagine synthase (glutamine-hydrolysing)